MNYELAKQLKDAGFPKKVKVGGSFYHFISHPSAGIPPQQAVNTSFVDRDLFDDDVAIPTLPELIEACRDGFGLLERIDGGWYAINYAGDTSAPGSIPEIAVAKLWLTLHKSK